MRREHALHHDARPEDAGAWAGARIVPRADPFEEGRDTRRVFAALCLVGPNGGARGASCTELRGTLGRDGALVLRSFHGSRAVDVAAVSRPPTWMTPPSRQRGAHDVLEARGAGLPISINRCNRLEVHGTLAGADLAAVFRAFMGGYPGLPHDGALAIRLAAAPDAS